MSKFEHQKELERLYSNNELLPRMRQFFIEKFSNALHRDIIHKLNAGRHYAGLYYFRHNRNGRLHRWKYCQQINNMLRQRHQLECDFRNNAQRAF